MTIKDVIKALQRGLNQLGAEPPLAEDGHYGAKTESALKAALQAPSNLPDTPAGNLAQPIPWYHFSKRFKGKRETDAAFAKFMIPQWRLVGLNLKTIAKNWAAWCGLAAAVSLAGVGMKVQKDGAAAKNWAKYGQAIIWRTNGIPRGAFVTLNSKECGASSNNHVTMADGDCAPEDLLKPNATFPGYGGNQSNQWKTSIYAVRTICSVRWPDTDADGKPIPLPGRVAKSVGCGGKANDNESTR